MDKKYKFNSIGDFFKAYPSEYHFLHKKKLITKLCEDMGWKIKKKGIRGKIWTKEECIEDALKYKINTEWDKNSPLYRIALKNGWLAECTTHMRRYKSKNYWTKKLCKEDAKKYNKRTQWIEHSSSAYNAAKKNGWLDECTAHMIIVNKPNGYWTLERCQEEALKFNKRGDWSRYGGNGSYLSARKNGWLDECCKHMKNYGKKI